MDAIRTQIQPDSDDFRARKAYMTGLCDELRGHLGRIREGGSERARARHEGRGKLFVRQRIDKLLDAGSPFLEFSALAAHEVYGTHVPAGGVITGLGRVHGQTVLVVANDATVKGGSYLPLTVFR